jgi:hypothetical protein
MLLFLGNALFPTVFLCNCKFSYNSSAIHSQSREDDNLRSAYSSPIKAKNSKISRKSTGLKIVNIQHFAGSFWRQQKNCMLRNVQNLLKAKHWSRVKSKATHFCYLFEVFKWWLRDIVILSNIETQNFWAIFPSSLWDLKNVPLNFSRFFFQLWWDNFNS